MAHAVRASSTAPAAPRAHSAQLTLATAIDRARRVRESQSVPALLARRAFREATKILQDSREDAR